MKTVEMSEISTNASELFKLATEQGRVLITENNKPKFVISKIDDSVDNEKLETVAKQILKKHKRAFEVLGE